MTPPNTTDGEWLEADGSGGFASGTVGLERTRRYHALLLAAATPPTGRIVLVNGLEAWIDNASGTLPLSTQRYGPDVVYPDISVNLMAFSLEPWPSWSISLPDGTGILHEVFVQPDSCETVLRWRRVAGTGACRLRVRLLMSGRDYHALHRENSNFRFDASRSGRNVSWRPYADFPAITALSDGVYEHAPEWFRNFIYTAERARGLDDIEDLASPGVFSFDLTDGASATILLRAGDSRFGNAAAYGAGLAAMEHGRRGAIDSRLLRSARSYRVARDGGQTLIAGFPWFTDWGRDTFISMRGLVLAAGALDAAEDILCAWAGAVSEGMLPNRFADQGESPEYNAVDASLWYIVAAHEFLEACTAAKREPGSGVAEKLQAACEGILQGYTSGTRFGIVADSDGLLKAGVPGVQLTWMDAKTGDHVVTPRIGKPVEVQALWINALRIGARWSPHWGQAADRAQAAFTSRFVAPSGGLFDVVDCDHVGGSFDASLRPNQILAVGGLPFAVLDGKAARDVVDLVELKLLTPLGLRTLAPEDPAYIGHYRGGPAERDGAYHQGTVWPWLMGPFVDAWLAVRGRTDAAKAAARDRFLPPLMAHLDVAGRGHVSEIADGDAPHMPGGCPFQAWSLGELMRVRRMLDCDV